MLKEPWTRAYFSRVAHWGLGGGTGEDVVSTNFHSSNQGTDEAEGRVDSLAQYPEKGVHAVKKAICVAIQPRATYPASQRTACCTVSPNVKRVYMINMHALMAYITLSMACSDSTTIFDP